MYDRTEFDSAIFIKGGKTNVSYDLYFHSADVHIRDKGFNVISKRYGFGVTITYTMKFGNRTFTSKETINIVIGNEVNSEFNRVMSSLELKMKYLANTLKKQPHIDAFHATLLPILEKYDGSSDKKIR